MEFWAKYIVNNNQQGNLSPKQIQKILKRPNSSKSKPTPSQSQEEKSVVETKAPTLQPIVPSRPQYNPAAQFNEIRSELAEDFRANYDDSDWD